MHLIAGALWLGAAPAVALVLWDPSTPDAEALTVIRRFSRVAGFALAVVIVAGALSALILTDLFAAGVLTTYGVILGAKSGLVGLAALGGALGRRSLGREPERRRYQRLFMLDSALLVGVVVLSAGLSLVGPHEGHAGHVASARCAATVGEASAAVVLSPGRAGPNGALVSGVAHTVEGVTLDLAHERTGEAPLQVPLGHAADGWAGTAVLPLAGEWQATVVVRVDTFTEARGSCTLTVTP